MDTHTELTPMMQQYWQIKKAHPAHILFYRMGDFYEMFFEDAKTVASALHLTLTARGKTSEGPVPMAGVPVAHADAYLAKLLKLGFSVAICEQTPEAPAHKKGLMSRQVVRILTPGTLLEEAFIQTEKPQRLCAIYRHEHTVGIATLDLSDSTLMLTEFPGAKRAHATTSPTRMDRIAACHWCVRNHVVEIVIAEGQPWTPAEQEWLQQHGVLRWTSGPHWEFSYSVALQKLQSSCGFSRILPPELRTIPACICAAGGLLAYAESMLQIPVYPVQRWRIEPLKAYMHLDAHTRRHLELSTDQQGGETHTLLRVLRRTQTPMGTRLLHDWLHQPLCDAARIDERNRAVAALYPIGQRAPLTQLLSGMRDAPRILGRMNVGTATPRDLADLSHILSAVPAIGKLAAKIGLPAAFHSHFGVAEKPAAVLSGAIAKDPPSHIREGGVFRKGYDATLDQLREQWGHTGEVLAQLEHNEQKRTGLSHLKVLCNRIHGYYIELPRSVVQKNTLPEDYVRCQTLKHVERFKSQSVRDFEHHMLHAENAAIEREKILYQHMLDALKPHLSPLLRMAHSLAELDVLSALAEVAESFHWVKPEWVKDTGTLAILQGKHPILASTPSNRFVPNNCALSHDSQRIAFITGPNMGGKSTYMRQTALIVLLAHTGSFVPAQSVRLSLCDRIFSRIGASDDAGNGRSTFLVEMQETAEILRHATSRSLTIIDEIGRGTCPEEGLAIARSVLSYMAKKETGLVLFSTHFSGLSTSAKAHNCACLYFDANCDASGELVFSHLLKPGICARSYGIDVAALAGLPASVVAEAREYLTDSV